MRFPTFLKSSVQKEMICIATFSHARLFPVGCMHGVVPPAALSEGVVAIAVAQLSKTSFLEPASSI